MRLRICHLYPEHLNIYADRGNMAVLQRRCEWRGISFELTPCGPGEPTPTADLYDERGDELASVALQFGNFGGRDAFSGPVRTIRC